MNKEKLYKSLKEIGLDIDEKKSENLEDLLKKTLETNQYFNLTAITDEEVFREKMIFDSALAMVGLDLKNKNVIDVGTGAGFPGMVIYILQPEACITLLDATAKKINYLKEYSSTRGYDINFVIARMEEYALSHRDYYDFAFARAVSKLNILLEMMAPILKVGGYFVALKGSNAIEEINESSLALKKLGMEIEKVNHYLLDECQEERNIILIRKVNETPKQYPRPYKDIKKKPL